MRKEGKASPLPSGGDPFCLAVVRIDTEVIGRVLVVAPHGELDLHTAEEFKRVTDRELERANARHIVVDCSGLTFVDSSGLGAILGRYKKVSQIGGQMVFAGVPEQTRSILRLSGILKIIPEHHDPKRAVRCISGVAR
ncbi:MAG: anti-sigma factor antagonist [Bacillota bacterium]